MKKELIRTGGLLVIATIMLALTTFKLPDPTYSPLLTSSAILFYIAAFSHVIRKLVLPSINTPDFVHRAKEGSVAAAIVVAAVIWGFVSLVQAGIALLK